MERTAFHQSVLEALDGGGVPVLIGGSHALACHAGLTRPRRDLDLMIRRRHWPWAEQTLRSAGIDCRLVFPHWLGKATSDDVVVDLIFNSGNGVAIVDDDWFSCATRARLFDRTVLISPPEELLWSKSFVMERERFDGADVLHLVRARQREIDWSRLLSRFGEHWRVLLSHLVLFPYVYPNEPAPQQVIDELLSRAKSDTTSDEGIRLCRGPLLSRAQYLVDVERWNYVDAREVPLGTMTPEEIDIWTRAIETKK